jgi:hypothetical protein
MIFIIYPQIFADFTDYYAKNGNLADYRFPAQKAKGQKITNGTQINADER